MKRPSFQFYPGDWVRDSVSGCSLAAQGLWLRMMIVAHDSERYGYLEQNGAPMPPDSIARRCGCESAEQYSALLSELREAGVPSRTEKGVIFSRRMVRDEALREARAAGGSESLKNPNVARPKSQVEDEGKDADKGPGKDGGEDASETSSGANSESSSGVSPSSSSSSSLSTSKQEVKTSGRALSKNDGAVQQIGGIGSQRTKKQTNPPTDPRFTATQELLAMMFSDVCSKTETPPWDRHATKNLQEWLNGNGHDLDQAEVSKLVTNAAKSQLGPQLLRDPAALIPKLRKYNEPLDKFGGPLAAIGQRNITRSRATPESQFEEGADAVFRNQ